MDHIETAILNCYGIREAEQNMVFAARLTQHGHTIQNMADLMDLYHQSYNQKTVENIAGLPHPTVQKFMVITVAVVGASRRMKGYLKPFIITCFYGLHQHLCRPYLTFLLFMLWHGCIRCRILVH